MVKEDHILEVELKQVAKKLKEDTRIVMMWEEQDQAGQRLSVNNQDNLLFKERIKRQNLPNCKKCHLCNQEKSKWRELLQKEEEPNYKSSAIKQPNAYFLKL